MKKGIIDTMKYLLSNKIPIIGGFGVPFDAKFSRTEKSGVISDNVNIDFDYGIVFIGYSDELGDLGKGYFIFQNSWGKRWGAGGIGYLSYESVIKHKILDLWVINKFQVLNSEWINQINYEKENIVINNHISIDYLQSEQIAPI